MRLCRNRRAETGVAVDYRDLACRTTIPLPISMLESRLSGNGSISLVGCKNVPEKITER
jgi:hypothetical protein